MTSLVQTVALMRTRSAFLRAPAALAMAVAACLFLLWGRSYPGFPMSAVALATLAAVVLALYVPRQRTAVLLLAVTLVLSAGVATTVLVGDSLVHARWQRSAPAFAQQVESLGPPPVADTSQHNGSWTPVHPACPPGLGSISLSECVAVDRGYLFLQAPNAVTDSSGIAYLPQGNNPHTTGLDPHDLTPLGGPWWSWTCHC